MFKKFLNDAKNSIKSELNDFINETKEEVDIRNKKELFQKIDESKDSIKKTLQNEKLDGKDVAVIADATFFGSIGGIGLEKGLGDTKLFNNAAGSINKIINKVENAIPENSLFKDNGEKNENTILETANSNLSESNHKAINETKTINKTEMISENLNSLIEFALVDGELSEKEKQILFKKAESEGIDLDEFEMILNAKLFKIKQNQNPQVPPASINVAPKSDKFGDIKKCPSCGAIVETFSTRCVDCGYDFSNIQANASVQKLFEMINDLECKRDNDETNPIKAFGSVLTKSFGLGVGDRVNHQKKELISNFPIPNTKSDIIEFLTLALPKAKKAGNFFTAGSFNTPANDRNRIHNEFVPIWKSKCEQIILKARFTMKEDKKTLEEIEFYAQQLGI